MKKLFVAAAVVGLVGTSNAQSAFEGFYGQIGIGYENNNIGSYTASYANPSFSGVANSTNNGSFSGVIGLGYNHSISKDFLLGIGFDYGAVPSNTFNTSVSSAGDVYGNKVSNRYNIFITPGYVIDKNQLAYFKAGYSSQSLKITDLYPGYSAYGETVGSGNVNGYVFGLGYKQMIQSGFYGFAEANYYNYSSASFGSKTLSNGAVVTSVNPKSSAYQFLVGVGYKF